MKIINNSTETIYFDICNYVYPGDEAVISENCFDSRHIHSNIGSVVIMTEYCEREIKNWGNLKAKEINKTDENGMKCILVYN